MYVTQPQSELRSRLATLQAWDFLKASPMETFIKSTLSDPSTMSVLSIGGVRAKFARMLFVLFAMTMSFSAQAQSLTCDFTGPTNGSWTNNANWTCSNASKTVPGTADSANIVDKIVRVLSSASAIGNNVLLMSSTGTAQIIIEAGGSLTLGTVNVVGSAASFENSGTVDLSADITSSGGARFNNLPSGIVEASSFLNMDILFDNKGLASLSGVTLADATKFSQTQPNATLNFGSYFGGTGTLTLAAGTVRPGGGGEQSFSFSTVINTGATIYPSPDGDSTGGIYIGGNYQQSGSGKLSLMYCSDPVYPSYDSIYFSNATLGGTVEIVSVCNTPLTGENFTPISSSGTMTGTFASVRLPSGGITAAYTSENSAVKFTFGTPPPPEPIMTVAVSPTSVAPGTSATVMLTLSSLLGVTQYIDGGITMPPGLLVQALPAPETNCPYDFREVARSPLPIDLKSGVRRKPAGLMSISIDEGATGISFYNGLIPNTGSCTVTFSVQAANLGTYAITVLPGDLESSYSNINTSVAVLSVVPPGPSIDVNLGSIDFGRQGVGITSTVQPVIITNVGIPPLTLTGFTISGDFGYTSNCPISPATLLSGDTCKVDISFTPLTPAALTGRFAVNSDAVFGNSSTLLYGQGVTVPIPNISLSANSLVFGDQAIGSISSIQSIVVTNTGTATLLISNIAFNNAAVSAGFTLIAGRADPVPPNPPIPATTPACGGSVPPAGSCFVSLIFSPTRLGEVPGSGPGAASLNITHNATATGVGTTIRSVGLSANGTPRREPSIRVTGGNSGVDNANFSFAEQVIGTTGSPQAVLITNTGTANLDITSLVVIPTNGTTNAGDFTLGGNCATVIVPNASCGLTIRFSPLAPIGAKVANLVISSNASNATQPAGTTSVRLSGLAAAVPVPIVRLNPTTIGFGTGLLGAPTTQRLTVSNVGQLPLNVTRISLTGEDYSQTNDCSSPLNPTQSCTINLTFSPQGIGSRPGTLTITSNATPTTNTVPLTGTGCVFVPFGAGRFFVSTCGNSP